ncbi:class I adenylate-forming enzyme family protein [Prescottella defluvii]|uniref:class I adenylate-forming enzyme family protein n=1 Tax=Prescottella defluvii TaxID=1323361 RepID=UPI0004F2C967|nr:AMP-binding protein [Prescottella defluvii]
MNLNTLLESSARKFPTKDALIHVDRRVSYAELLSASRRAATVFAEAGVRRGDRVAVMTTNTPEFVIAAFGIWRAGGVLVPVNHKLQVPEVRYTIEHSGARVGVVGSAFAEIVTAAAPETTWLTTDAFRRAVDQAPESDGVAVTEDDLAQVLYTSGTTSAPKGCEHTHRSIASVPPLIASTIPLTRDDRMLIAMPIWHASPLNNWMLTTLFLGGTVVLLEEYDPIAFLETVQEHKVTAFFGAPVAYLAPLQVCKAKGLDFTSYDLSSVDKWIYGGAPLGEETARMLVEAYRTDRFYQVYGMSEMGPVGTALYPDEQLTRAGSIGRGGMPGVDLRVVTPNGSDAKAGDTGEIWMRADTRMRGYLGNPAATADAFTDGWYRTGDVARIDEDGFLFIVDRLKDVIIVGGENVYSQEVEESLRAHPRIADVAVIGRPDPQWGEIVVAVVVTSDGADLSIEEIREYLADKLARYKLPREAITVDTLPRNPSGKLTKHTIRDTVL